MLGAAKEVVWRLALALLALGALTISLASLGRTLIDEHAVLLASAKSWQGFWSQFTAADWPRGLIPPTQALIDLGTFVAGAMMLTASLFRRNEFLVSGILFFAAALLIGSEPASLHNNYTSYLVFAYEFVAVSFIVVSIALAFLLRGPQASFWPFLTLIALLVAGWLVSSSNAVA